MRKGVASFSGLAAVVLFVLGGARPAPAQQPTGQVVRLGEGETLTIGGLINGTLVNDGGLFRSFRQGQNAEIGAAPGGGVTSQPGINRGVFEGDVPYRRLNLNVHAP